jgi:hypothetical protein
LLDWKFSATATNQTSTLEDFDKRLVVNLSSNGGIFKLDTQKTVYPSGHTNRVLLGCKDNIPAKNLGKEIQELLLSLE